MKLGVFIVTDEGTKVMKRQGWFAKSLMMVSLILTGVWGINVTVSAATIPEAMQTSVSPIGATTSLDEALPDSDGNAKIIKTAILASDTSLTGSSTLAAVANKKVTVSIKDNLTDYTPLLKVANQFDGLIVNNQTNLSQTNISAIITSLLTNRGTSTGTELKGLGFSNDNVDTAGLSTILDTIGRMNSAPEIQYLILNHNPVTDFTPWTAFKKSANSQKVWAINASILKNKDGSRITEGKTIAPQTLKGSIIKVPYSAFSEYAEADIFRADNAQMGIRAYTDDADSSDSEVSLIGVQDGPLRGELAPDLVTEKTEQFVSVDDSKQIIDVSRVNGVDLSDIDQGYGSPAYIVQMDDERNQNLLSSLKDFKGFTYIQPGGDMSTDVPENVTDRTMLTVAGVPAGSKQVKVRLEVTYEGDSSLNEGGSYSQIYTIPIKQAPVTPIAPSAASSSSPDRESSSADSGQQVVKRQSVIYATKKIGLYRTPDFSNKTRQAWYLKRPRIYRPMFKVTGYAKSTNGTPRYLVKDVNHASQTYGETGYVTTKSGYVQASYYQRKSVKVTVIARHGINAYRQRNLTRKTKHYRQGQVLKVVGLVRHNLTTRYVLKNGDYVTANKKNVQSGRIVVTKRVVTKTTIKRYREVNLTRQQKIYRKGTKVAVKGWDYSANGTKRYRVANGYITANSKLVKTIH
ncbi:DUF5776 domain-containing protein [Levilactobacillus sp. N40-8-2]|uniref:DUF5776 domain-containing protein n=1 Tax=Levilactobacillus muriae TaxID=3238987 RepID=UPI0038B29A52